MDTKRTIKLLIVEDEADYARVIALQLRREGYDPECKVVDNAVDMLTELESPSWDVVICDWKMPRFDALSALNLVIERGIDIPFIVLSGVIPLREGIDIMRAGAYDCVMKEDLIKLSVIIERGVREARMRRNLKKISDEHEQRIRRLELILDK